MLALEVLLALLLQHPNRLDEAAKQRLGRWAAQGSSAVLNQAYLIYLPPQVLLACGDWWMDSDVDQHHAFFAPRMCMEVSDNLRSKVFPSMVEQLLASINKVRA